jgi:hypothetical protein
MREKDASDIRPYALAGAWASVIPGVRSGDFVTDNYAFHPLYGEDNLPDPWSHPQIQRVQRAFSPVLVADRDCWESNKLSDPEGRWPSHPATITPGAEVQRTLVVFNDSFSRERVDVRWELRTGAPNGAVAARGALPLEVPLGSHLTKPITFTAPASPGVAYLVLAASKPGDGELFRDDDEQLLIAAG